MSKTNDTAKLRIEDAAAFTLELGGANTFTMRDVELQKVSGGYKMSDVMVSNVVESIGCKYTLFLPDGM